MSLIQKVRLYFDYLELRRINRDSPFERDLIKLLSEGISRGFIGKISNYENLRLVSIEEASEILRKKVYIHLKDKRIYIKIGEDDDTATRFEIMGEYVYTAIGFSRTKKPGVLWVRLIRV